VRWLALVALVVLLALPAWLNSYAITVFIFIFFYAFLGQAWNIVGGYAGQLSAGHAAFVGIGAYASAVLSAQAGLTPWLGTYLAGHDRFGWYLGLLAAAAALAWAAGWIAVRRMPAQFADRATAAAPRSAPLVGTSAGRDG